MRALHLGFARPDFPLFQDHAKLETLSLIRKCGNSASAGGALALTKEATNESLCPCKTCNPDSRTGRTVAAGCNVSIPFHEQECTRRVIRSSQQGGVESGTVGRHRLFRFTLYNALRISCTPVQALLRLVESATCPGAGTTGRACVTAACAR